MTNQSDLLADIAERVDQDLSTSPHMEKVDHIPNVDQMKLEKRHWKQIDDVVVVVADLKGSTKLNFDKYAKGSAKLYEALCGNTVRILSEFDPAFIDVQGDGFFGLFDGDLRYQRALCAAITLKTFSEEILVPKIADTSADRFPSTGLKVGMAAGTLAVKKVGIRGTNEPVWAGKPVNWAFKAAQAAEAHELVVTRRVFTKFENNDYVTHSCDCGTPLELWSDFTVDKLPEADQDCMVLRSNWCNNCGDDFCEAIMAGEKSRSSVVAA